MSGLLGFVLIFFGAISVMWPYSAWYLSVGWKLKDAEPSDLALTMNRVGGSLMVIVGFIVMLSSCSSGGGQGGEWPERLKAQLAAGEVQQITIGMFEPVPLTQEETDGVVEMIKASKLEAFDPGSTYGASNTGRIVFKDSSSVELVIFGPSGGIELHPNHTKKKYKIISEPLKHWFREYHSNH